MRARQFALIFPMLTVLFAVPGVAAGRVSGLAPSPVYRPGGVTDRAQPQPRRRGYGHPVIVVPYAPTIQHDTVVDDPVLADFERLDRNNNNRISLLEAHAQAGLHNLLPAFDSNGDGSLDLGEYRALRKAGK